jgi:hypothetical protein
MVHHVPDKTCRVISHQRLVSAEMHIPGSYSALVPCYCWLVQAGQKPDGRTRLISHQW